MKRTIATAIIAMFAAVLTAGFFSALPAPLSAIHLPLILIVSCISDFRFKDAIAAAAAGGITLDLASADAFGAATLILCAVTVTLFPLFTRVFTNRSLAGHIGITVVAFMLLGALHILATTAGFWLAAYPVAPLYSTDRFVAFLAGLAAFTAAAVVARFSAVAARRGIGAVIMMR